MHRRISLIAALMASLLASAACDDENLQACDPGETERCPEGEACAVDPEGTPRCVPPGLADEGDACRIATDSRPVAEAERCAAGLGCLRVAGVSRCLRFCDPALSVDECRPEGPSPVQPGLGAERLRQFARCAAVLPDRPEIGACVLPCRPERQPNCDTPGTCAAFGDDCPGGAVCGLAPAAPVPVCVPAGDGVEGAACDAERACAEGLLCARLDGEARCRFAPDTNDACPMGRTAAPLPGIDDPVTTAAVPERVCVPVDP